MKRQGKRLDEPIIIMGLPRPLVRETTTMRGYILINVRPGKVRDVVEAVGRLEGVRHADACWGLPDVFAYVEATDEKAFNSLVIDQIQKIEGVDRTETHIALG
ncbi:MAG TPA: Lrp/AsnC ligand binding domain-containing protein [Terriglobia bacterium]|nr:Lrp/AsnC ligand binding domain-containing protein [Terriglobia bacterium]